MLDQQQEKLHKFSAILHPEMQERYKNNPQRGKIQHPQQFRHPTRTRNCAWINVCTSPNNFIVLN